MFTIEKNVPLPVEGREHNLKYPYPEMEIGDSFLAPATDCFEASKIRSSAYAWGRRNGHKFKTARDGDGIRVFMIA